MEYFCEPDRKQIGAIISIIHQFTLKHQKFVEKLKSELRKEPF